MQKTDMSFCLARKCHYKYHHLYQGLQATALKPNPARKAMPSGNKEISWIMKKQNNCEKLVDLVKCNLSWIHHIM